VPAARVLRSAAAPIEVPARVVREVSRDAGESARALPGTAVPDPAQEVCTDRWVGCCQQLFERNALRGLVRELAWQAQCIAIDDQAAPARWTLRVERESLAQASHRDRVQEALGDLLGQPVQVEIVIGVAADSAARRDAAARARAQEQAEALIRSDPVVLDLLARFPTARIVPGSIRPA
jgi:DNA polymerase-3 subunit gamma/tau